jgi:hypothetical protein
MPSKFLLASISAFYPLGAGTAIALLEDVRAFKPDALSKSEVSAIPRPAIGASAFINVELAAAQ